MFLALDYPEKIIQKAYFSRMYPDLFTFIEKVEYLIFLRATIIRYV